MAGQRPTVVSGTGSVPRGAGNANLIEGLFSLHTLGEPQPNLGPQYSHAMRPTSPILFTISAALLLGGCESTQGTLMNSPDPEPLRLSVADEGYHLTATDRAKIRPGFDVQALQKLLRAVRPDLRAEILAHFQFVEDGVRRGILVQLHEVELQPLLEEVWAPMWEEVKATDADLAENTFGFPGRQIALQRREARRSGKPSAQP